MPKTVRETTAEWAKEAKRFDRFDRNDVADAFAVVMSSVLAVCMFTSDGHPEIGWVFVGNDVVMLALWWRRRRRRLRST